MRFAFVPIVDDPPHRNNCQLSQFGLSLICSEVVEAKVEDGYAVHVVPEEMWLEHEELLRLRADLHARMRACPVAP